MHPNTRITAQAADEEGVVVFNFEVLAVERFGFDADADHGLPVAAVVDQFVSGFEVGGIDPILLKTLAQSSSYFSRMAIISSTVFWILSR